VTRTGKLIRLTLAAALLVGGWYCYRLLLGRPLNINHFADRASMQMVILFPEVITFLGLLENSPLDFHSDRLDDLSPGAMAEFTRLQREALQTLHEYDRDSLSGQQALTYDYLDFRWAADLAAADFAYHFNDLAYRGPYPANPTQGAQLAPIQTLTQFQQVMDEDSAQRYLSRMAAIPAYLESLKSAMNYRAEQGVIPPQIIMQRLIEESAALVATPADEWSLSSALVGYLDEAKLDAATHQALLAQNLELLETAVIPAYREFLAYLEILKSSAPEAVGMWSLPDGDRYYQALLRVYTTSNLAAEDIHRIGLQRVAELQQELDRVLRTLGYSEGSVGERVEALARSAEGSYKPGADLKQRILADYTQLVRELEDSTDVAFREMPLQRLEVRAVPVESEAGEAGAYYRPPALDGTRPGVFYVNLRDPASVQRFSMRTLAAHEGVPGHHLQVALVQQLEGLPLIRNTDYIAAYGEGWGLYAERLVHDIGLHDAFSDVGRLQAEIFRAVRLVVDTGIHFKGWTREQAIAYMREHTGEAESAVVPEIERYIAMPGQACAYMMGMLEILALREEARERLGERFTLPDFHEAVLKNGPLPLALLRREVEAGLQ